MIRQQPILKTENASSIEWMQLALRLLGNPDLQQSSLSVRARNARNVLMLSLAAQMRQELGAACDVAVTTLEQRRELVWQLLGCPEDSQDLQPFDSYIAGLNELDQIRLKIEMP